MKKIYIIILIFNLQSSIFNFQSFSQTAPGIEWQNTIGGSSTELLYDIKQNSDGSYILGGYSHSNISGDKTEDSWNNTFDYWIVKADSLGDIQWQNTIGGTASDMLHCVQQTTDGGYILGGFSNSDISGDKTENSMFVDYWIVKTDAIGNIQWQNTIKAGSQDHLYSIQQTTDGGYILGGNTDSDSSGDKTENSNGGIDGWIIKTDSSGTIQWQNTIGGGNNDPITSLQQTVDGGYIIGAASNSNISGDKTENSNGGYDCWIIKTDSMGTIQWQNTIGGNGDDGVISILQTTDGEYIFGGYSSSNISGDKTENCYGYSDYWIVKTDSSGTIQWQSTIGGASFDQLTSVSQTSDKGYIIGGYSNSGISGNKTENSNGDYDYWLLKLDSTGTIRWQNTVGGTDTDNLSSIRQTIDGGYILGGHSKSPVSGDKTENSNGDYDYWIIKLAPDTITGIPNFQIPNSNFQINPNPLTTQSKLTFKNPNKEKFLFTLYDITGRITESVSTTNNEIILTKGSKQAGVYLFNLMNEKTRESWNGKIVITN